MKKFCNIYEDILTISKNENIKEADIEGVTKSMCQEFFNQINKNDSKIIEGERIFNLKPSKYLIPRKSSIKAYETRWEKFAREKGIKQRKKSKKVFSEETGKWEFRYGSESLSNQKIRGGIVEVEQSISKIKREKQKRKEKNIKQMLKNKVRNK